MKNTFGVGHACFCGIWFNCKLFNMFFVFSWTVWGKQQLKANHRVRRWALLVRISSVRREISHTPQRLNYALCCKIPDVNTQMLFLLFCLWWLAAKEFKSHPHSNCPSVTKSLLFRRVCLCRQNLCSRVGASGRGLKKGGENIFMHLAIQKVVRLACAGCGIFSFFLMGA